MSDFSGKRAVVMGLGRFGGGIGVTRWLCGQGARVHVTDLAKAEHLASSLKALDGLDVTTRLGSHEEADLQDCDLLVISPAVDKAKSEFVKAAVSRGIPCTSEMNLFLERCRGRIVGVTGSVGKSTTTAMIGAILESAALTPEWKHGRVCLGGNIGRSLLDDLARIERGDVVVLELSSFQLEDAAAIRKSPHIALVTNLKENHLDRHGTMEAYAAAKGNIYKFQGEEDWLVMPQGGGVELLPGGWQSRQNLLRFGVDPDSFEAIVELPGHGRPRPWRARVHLSVPGLHNLQNASAALAVTQILGVPGALAAEALARFKGLAHRLELVGRIAGVTYYNDSKATTPEAAMTSLAAFDGGIVVLVGGSDKGNSFVALGRRLVRQAKAVICMGDTREKIAGEVTQARGSAEKPLIRLCDDFTDAVNLARSIATEGDVVLLSPGCASYDWFTNYEERGEAFRRLVLGA